LERFTRENAFLQPAANTSEEENRTRHIALREKGEGESVMLSIISTLFIVVIFVFLFL